MHRVVHDVARAVFLLGGQLLETLLGIELALAGGAVHAAQGRGGKAEGAQRVLHRGERLAHADQQDVAALLFLMDRENFGFLVDGLDRGAHRLHGETGREGAHQHRGAPGALKIQGQIQTEPGLQGFDHRAQPALLRADALDARVIALDGFRRAQRPGKAGVVQQDAVFQLGLCGEKLRLFRRILIQQGNGVRQTRVPGLEGGQLA